MRNMSKKTWKLRVWNHMTEIQKLDLLLKRAKVPHTYGRRWPEMDRPDNQEFLPGGRHDGGEQIIAYDAAGNRIWDGVWAGVPMALGRGLSRRWVCSCLAMMMLRAGSRLVRLRRCGGVEMLRKIAEYVKKIFRMEPIPTTVNTLREALQSLEVARNHFEHCDPEFVDAAIFELNAAECRVDAVRRCAE